MFWELIVITRLHCQILDLFSSSIEISIGQFTNICMCFVFANDSIWLDFLECIYLLVIEIFILSLTISQELTIYVFVETIWLRENFVEFY